MSYNVLVVDDSVIIRSMVRRALSMSGLDVGEIHEAGDGIDALKVLSREWIDIVFLDIHMPRMTGEELVEKMHEDDLLTTTPVVVISSDQSDTRREHLEKLGVRGYLHKPFRPEHFREMVQSILG